VSTPSARPNEAAADRLRSIHSLTDSGLANLSVEDLLVELLDRVRDVLGADTAAVLLLDRPNEQLVATAARGIEEEVYQGARVPLGRGFAGRVAASRQPVTIDDIDDADVVNPLLRERGIRSLLGVPLLAGGELLGVLHVGTLHPRHFSAEDVDLLQMVADRVALATRSSLSDTERRASGLLQRSLLPERLPHVPGLETAARYSAGGAATVGGDWYDVFTLPSGRVCITVGDVVGRGVRAAAVMGRVRSSLRAHALGNQQSPSAILDMADRQLRHFEPGEMATVVVAILDPTFETVHLSIAGHPPPVLAVPDGPSRFLGPVVDPPLGVARPGRRRVTSATVPPGAVLCFYTDGLVERRDALLDDRLELLRTVVSPAPAETVCSAVMARLIGLDRSEDDVAVLAVRRVDGGTDPLEVTMPAVASALGDVRAALRRWLADAGAGPTEVTDVLVAVGEATSNVVEHAYGPEGGQMSVRLELREPDLVVASVRDSGRWRPPRGTNRGRGALIMQAAADEVTVDRGPGGTQVVIQRRLGRPEDSS
jgi:anti-sigma regulatory factor (Ser/Thr protein kinase)/putative methionine-R-sulfoxide reductase with GAF domain